MDLKIKCGGYVSSIRNPDGTELLAKPVHNMWLNRGLVLLSGGCGQLDGGAIDYTLSARCRMFGTSSSSEGLFPFFYLHLGSGDAASTRAMTALSAETNYLRYLSIPSKLTMCEIVNGKFHLRFSFTFSSAYTIREFGLDSPDSLKTTQTTTGLLLRVVLDAPVIVQAGSTLDYDFYMTLPYFTRTVVTNLFGTGLPGEVWLRPAYNATKTNLLEASVGYPITSLHSYSLADNIANTSSPWGLFSHGYIDASDIYTRPMFSSSTTKDFPADGVGDAALPITCASAAYNWVSHDLTNYVAVLKYVIPASAGAMSIAYGNVRGLAFRFGSYDSSGAWVGQTLNKTASQKLNIQLTYSFSSM